MNAFLLTFCHREGVHFSNDFVAYDHVFTVKNNYGENSILRRKYVNTLKKVNKHTSKIHHFDLDMSYATHAKIIELHQERSLKSD